MVSITVWVLVGALILLAAACLMDRDLFRACWVFIAFAMVMALIWLMLGEPWLALAEAVLGAGLTGGTLLWTLRGRGKRPRLAPLDRTPRRRRLTAHLRWLMTLTWLGLTSLAIGQLQGLDARMHPLSVDTLFALTGLLVMSLGLWAFAAQRHLLRLLLAFNLIGSGVFLLLASVAVPRAEVRALILIGLTVGLLGSVLGAAVLLRLHALTGQVSLMTPPKASA
ncbi:putative monovalent cation/H+ antiporter subunit B [Thiorhodovibrio winogradskyi]|uniref:Monovalent cation/H+ antiporter subunit B n=1 Tax=Thiorhodovibrio winogradskyi TaxID=77007 RepID=A0ABZ0S180_9GAMM|nr:hydrogenase subunit MbhD domain-containing protein [Thiorhodovibrio winogradskyi]